MSEAEWQTRLDLAACYRLVDLFGWSDLVNTRITARVPGQHDHFLINPYGLLFDEVTASSLVKIDAEGRGRTLRLRDQQRRVRDTERDTFGAARSRLRAPHPLDCRLRRIDAKRWAAAAQPACPAGNRRRREGTGRNPEERARLLADLGHRHILVLRNHGLLIVGTSIAAAFVATYRMERACAMQLAFQQSGAAFHPITDEVVSAAYSRPAGGRNEPARFEWPALLRKLDRIDPSYKE
jgi:ribulose-5-phosphate 4-epimerase/fuculose-1-phosphate aldolase